MVEMRTTTILPRRRAGTAVGPAPDDHEALAQQVANLQRALHNSRRIGAATGILMARQGWS